MTPSIWALAVAIGGSAGSAGAVDLEGAAIQASALAAETNAKIAKSPCRQAPQLDAAAFVVRFPAGAPQGGVSEYTVRFGSCEIEDSYYGEPIEPRAVRRYYSGDRRFGLVLTTESGAERSSISLSATHRGTHQLVGHVGERESRALLSSSLSFSAVHVMELDGVGGRMRPRAVSISPVEVTKAPQSAGP